MCFINFKLDYYEYECPPDDGLPAPAPSDMENGDSPSKGCPVQQPPEKRGNPITITSGNKYEQDEDLRFNSPSAIGFSFARHYNSRGGEPGPLGFGWRHRFASTIGPVTHNGTAYRRIVDPSGRGVYFDATTLAGAFHEKSALETEGAGLTWKQLDGSRWHYAMTGDTGSLAWIEDPAGNRLTLENDPNGRLTGVLDEATGRAMGFVYDESNRIAQVSGPVTTAVADGVWVRYTYDAQGNLSTVRHSDGSGLDYLYGDPLDPHNLTGKRDAAGHQLASWTYDALDRATSSTTRDGKNVTIDYLGEQKVKVTDGWGVERTSTLTSIGGVRRVTQVTGPSGCTTCSGNEPVSYTYDSAMRITSKTFADGSKTCYSNFDSQGRARTVSENCGAGQTPRTVSYTYHPVSGEPLTRGEPTVL